MIHLIILAAIHFLFFILITNAITTDAWGNVTYIYFSICLLITGIFQPGLIKIRTSVHILCDTVLRTLLHVSPQFQREMSIDWC